MVSKTIATLILFGAMLWTPASAHDASTAPTLFVPVGGDRIGYRDIGKGLPMVLITRMRGTIDSWDPLFLDELAKRNRVILVDYPGVGYSSGKLPAGIGDAAGFVVAFADAMKLDKFILMGWSWGGTVAQTVVVDHPGRVTHAILVATAPPGKNPVAIQQAFLDRAFKPVNDLDDETVLFFDPRYEISRDAAKKSRDRIYARPGVTERIPATEAQIRAYLAAAAEYHADAQARRERLMATHIPLLIICGDNDISTAVDNWFALNQKIPNAHLVVYPQSGHAPQHQYAELAALQVAAFLRYAIP
jgi:pimeloyl-ACP methyl ester carboxylesterase